MSMKNIFKYTIIAGAAALAMTSCDLDVFPATSIVTDPSVSAITSASDLESLTNGILGSFRGRFRGDDWAVDELMYGYFNAVTDFGNNFGAPHRLESNIADDYDIRDYWSGRYGAIKNYNVFIQNANTTKAEGLDKQLKLSKGYAFLFRATAYLDLVRHYGPAYGANSSSDLGVPVVTVFNLTEKPARATVKECYDQIKADLDSADFFLSGTAGKVASLTPTADCVYAEYARYYLDVKDYAKAEEYASKVINSSAKYKLCSSLEALKNYYFHENEAGVNTEAIMQMFISESEGGNSYTTFTGLSNYKSEGKGYVYIPYFIPTANLMNLYEPGDHRLEAWFDKDERYVRQNAQFYKGDFYVFKKFEGNAFWTTAKEAPGGLTATRPFTLPEMYLIASEAAFQAGKTDKAAEYLNALQEARGAILTTASLETIQNEWDKETVGEGMRLSNLKRWGKGFAARTPQAGAVADNCVMLGKNYTELSMSATDFHLVWPIPSYEMKVNDNLVQNSGYTAAED